MFRHAGHIFSYAIRCAPDAAHDAASWLAGFRFACAWHTPHSRRRGFFSHAAASRISEAFSAFAADTIASWLAVSLAAATAAVTFRHFRLLLY